MVIVETVPCQHIADYYSYKQKIHPCIVHNLLKRGYTEWSKGEIEGYFNNLFRPTIRLIN